MPTQIESRFKAKLGNQRKVNISPTLIIGLGGSGRKVCERLRRLFFTRFREPGLPVVDYLYIDTDPEDAAGQEGWDAIQEEIAFTTEDMVGVDINPLEVAPIFNNPNQNQHIFSWFHKSLKRHGTEICQNGAGQIRSAGRLAFFHHYSMIRERLTAKLDRITNPVAINRINADTQGRYNFQVYNNACEVYVVGSLAGGTGSGMFLDIAFLLKNIRGNLRPTGLFFLPSVFSHLGDDYQEKIRANGYAALMELDYMMAPNIGVGDIEGDYPNFPFHWDRNETVVPGPPFANVYLLDAVNNSGVPLSNDSVNGRDNEAYQMAAEFLFLDFKNSDFATTKRSLRSNLGQHLINETVFTSIDAKGFTNYMEYFPNRYSSFGLSFIKLNSARKKHAAAYFLGKSLASFWRESQNYENPNIDNQVKEALRIPNNIGNPGEQAHIFSQTNGGEQWDVATIKSFFLLNKQGKKEVNLLKPHLDEVTKDFREVKDEIKNKYKANIASGVDAVFGDIEQFHKHISEKIEQIWKKHREHIQEALEINHAVDALLITSNAKECHELMSKGLRDRLFSLISCPQTKGVAWAEEFINAAVVQLSNIANPGFMTENLLEGECPFELPQLNDNNDIAATKRRLVEAQAIKFAPFRNVAIRELDEILLPYQEREIEARKTALLTALEKTREALLDWCRLKYDSFIRFKAEANISSLKASLSTIEIVNQGRANEVKIVSGFRGDLAQYKGGLKRLQEERERLFSAIDRDSEDIKTIHIHSATSDQWYINQLRTVLNADPTEDWAAILANQSQEFFGDLSQKLNKNVDYAHLFDVCSRWEGMENDWVVLSEALNAFCFNQVTGFMANDSADVQFQRALQNGSIREQELISRAEMADAWIPHKRLPAGAGVPETVIGLPDIEDRATADIVTARVGVYAKAAPSHHENEEIVFYRELGAFPLFRIGSLADYAEAYSKTTGDDIFKRHTDFNLIPKLHDILPPTDEEKIEAINAVGKLLLEGLIIRCFEYVEEHKGEKGLLRFQPVPKSAVPLDGKYIGRVFLRAAKIYSSSENKGYRRALEELISVQKTRLKNGGCGDTNFEMLKVLGEYRMRIYPQEQRSSDFGNSDNQESFMRIVVNGLYRDYHAICAGEISRGKTHSTKQIDNLIAERVEQVDLEQVSREFPYWEIQARQDARVLKMPEERS